MSTWTSRNIAAAVDAGIDIDHLEAAAWAAAACLQVDQHFLGVLTPGDQTRYVVMIGTAENLFTAPGESLRSKYWVTISASGSESYPWDAISVDPGYAQEKWFGGYHPGSALMLASFLDLILIGLGEAPPSWETP